MGWLGLDGVVRVRVSSLTSMNVLTKGQGQGLCSCVFVERAVLHLWEQILVIGEALLSEGISTHTHTHIYTHTHTHTHTHPAVQQEKFHHGPGETLSADQIG